MALIDGDQITFTWQGHELSGIVIQTGKEMATIKLSTGYNIILPLSEMAVTSTQQTKTEQAVVAKIAQDDTLPRVSILHTGGTIASKVDYQTGAVTSRFTPEELISMVPEMTKVANISSRLLRNMASDDMRFEHYNVIGRAIIEEIQKDARGIIVTHGTDTLHYTAAALGFMLEELTIPVVLVGSQRSSDRGSSDASTNLIGALRFITELKAPGVYVAMHEGPGDSAIAIIDGLHARKMHSSARGAFKSVNAPLVARVADSVEILDQARLDSWRQRAGKTRMLGFDEELRIGYWKAHTHSWADELLAFQSFDGLLLEGTGLGHIPMNETDEFTREHTKILECVRELSKKMPVAIATQTIYGRVNLNVYRPQRILQSLGVLGDGCDMMPEVAFVKLAWLLSNERSRVRELYAQSLRGEISACSTIADL
jgi:glutamyl-tRNA(Gln) amidotransferase subunit D